MAISSIVINDTAELELVHPITDMPLGIFITLYGRDSEHHKLKQRQLLNRRLEVQSRGGKNKMTAELLEKEGLDVLAHNTHSWRSGDRPEIEITDGEWIPCSAAEARRLYEQDAWIKDQVDQFIQDRAGFLQK